MESSDSVRSTIVRWETEYYRPAILSPISSANTRSCSFANHHNRGYACVPSSRFLFLASSFLILPSLCSPLLHAVRIARTFELEKKTCLTFQEKIGPLFPCHSLWLLWSLGTPVGSANPSSYFSVSSILFIVLAVRLINPSSHESAIPKEVKRRAS